MPMVILNTLLAALNISSLFVAQLMGWHAAQGLSWPSMGPVGGQPEDVFEYFFEDFLERSWTM